MILEGEETTECGPLPLSASMSDSTVRISAAQVTRILQRAAELDARSDTLSLGELRHIAAEAGIAPAATDAAIRELMNKPESASDALPTPAADAAPSVAAVARPSPSPLRVVVGGAVGMAMGFFTALPAVVGLTAFGGGILYLVTRAIQSMKRGAVLDFQLQNFSLWFGILFGDMAIRSRQDGEVLAFVVAWWMVSAVVGGLLVRFGPREEIREDDDQRE